MAEQHLEAIRKGHEAFNQGDLGLAKHTLTDDVEWGTTGTWPRLRGAESGIEVDMNIYSLAELGASEQ
jgi:hypothetical protein